MATIVYFPMWMVMNDLLPSHKFYLLWRVFCFERSCPPTYLSDIYNSNWMETFIAMVAGASRRYRHDSCYKWKPRLTEDTEIRNTWWIVRYTYREQSGMLFFAISLTHRSKRPYTVLACIFNICPFSDAGNCVPYYYAHYNPDYNQSIRLLMLSIWHHLLEYISMLSISDAWA